MRIKIAVVVFLLALLVPCAAVWIMDGQPTTWIDADGGPGPEALTYPVLHLDMGGQWTDFELKASTNNFESEVYYIRSWGPTACPDDTNVWIYFLDDYTTNPLVWRKSEFGSSILSQLADPTNSEVSSVVVCPSHACVEDWRTWMSSTNESLVWSFLRYDGLGPQSNATGTELHYNMTVPVEWRSRRIAP